MGDDWEEDESSGANVTMRNVTLSQHPMKPARGRGRPAMMGRGMAMTGHLSGARPPPPPPSSGRGGGGGDVNGNYIVDGGGGGGRGFGGGGGRSSDHKETLEVESCHVGRLIGTRGATRRDIEERSGCRININQKDRSDPTAAVELMGSQDAVEKAKEIILEMTGGGIRSGGGGGGRSGGGEAGGSGGGRDCYKCGKPGHISRDCPQSENGSSGFGGVSTTTETSATKTNEDEDRPVINWKELFMMAEENKMAKWKDEPPIVKHFYTEHPDVTHMSPEAVAEFRKLNNNIVVMDLKDAKEDQECRKIPNPCVTFEHAFENHPDVLREIYKNKFVKPSPIQSQMWPMVLSGYDTIGIAQTGTGKTLAFLLPAFLHIEGQITPRAQRKGPSVLIMCPTRELALQIRDECKKYSYHELKCLCIYGGGNRREQMKLCAEGQDVIIATPGRLNDLVAINVIDVSSISLLILDEADRMLDLGFEPQIMKILLDIRPDRQTLMTSATWPEEVRRLARTYMTDPMTVFVGSLDLATVHTVTQFVEIVQEDEKMGRLFSFIEELQSDDKAIIFAGRKSTADHISSEFAMQGVSVQCLHGDREQSDREQALKDLKTGDVRILIATDVASRGLDIQDITWVINYDFPRNMEEYVHRVGRTGRAGKTGKAISFLERRDWGQAQPLIDILKEADQEVPKALETMAERYKAMRERRGADFKERGGGRNQWRREGQSVDFGGKGSKW